MKKIILLIFCVAITCSSIFSQIPEGFKYQAVVRDGSNTILNNQSVGMRMTILQGAIGGVVVYSETFSTSTNAYGLVNLDIGTGTSSYDFSLIDWSSGPYFIETAVDLTGGSSYVVMGTSQLMSVPFAHYSKISESSINDQVDDADSDTTNELISGATLNGTSLEITDAGGTKSVDLSSLDNSGTDDQNLNGSLNGTNLQIDIENGSSATVDLSALQDGVNDADSDPTNELQDWSNLPGIPAGMSDGIDNVDDADNDPNNELINSAALNGSSLEITDAGGTKSVDLSTLDNSGTDDQNLNGSLNGTNLQIDIENGSSATVDLSALQDGVNDADSDPTNELQDWSNLPGIPAGMSDGIDNVDDADNDTTNELQSLILNADTLTISGGNSVILSSGSSSSLTHGSWNWSPSDTSFVIPSSINYLIIEMTGTKGGNGQNAFASFSGAGGSCWASGGNGGQAVKIKVSLINVSPGDVISMNNGNNGTNGINSASCSSCGTGCNFSCSGDNGFSGDKINIRLNGNIIIELFGGQGGDGGTAGSPFGCSAGSSGSSGTSIIHPFWIITQESSTVSSGGPSMTINW